MSLIYTIKAKCKGCYACVRSCPCKAVKIQGSLAEVMSDRCVNCGTCLRVCVPKAKIADNDIPVVWSLLSEDFNVIAIPSSAFPAALPGIRPGQFVSALRKLGFREVMEDAFGAELVSREYTRVLKEKKEKPILSSTCPSVVDYIAKFYPQLVPNLAPVVSPMIAMGRLIKKYYDPRAKVVFIGPCVAKKAEGDMLGSVDAALTFADIKAMFQSRDIGLENQPEELFSGPKPNTARLFAISGGLLRTTGLYDDYMYNQVINVHGQAYVKKILKDIERGEINAQFINLFFCHGCINGPAIDNDLSIFRRRKLISDYMLSDANPKQTESDLKKFSGLDLKRSFLAQPASLPEPREKEVQKVLQDMDRAKPEDQFDCGACGYPSCRELAISVAQGQAEIEMCWPLMLQKLKQTQEGLIQVEKLTSLGQLSASIAHEVNNPLSGILVYTQLLAKKIEKGDLDKEAALGYLAKMEAELTRSTKLIRNLLDFARQSTPALKAVDLNEVVNRALDLASHSARLLNVEVVKEMAPAPLCILADADQLHQVVLNLIVNAVQAMPEGGTLTLRTGLVGDQLKIEIQDTGCGIAQENLPKLFTPFYTTKKEVKGVGLGLAVSYGIIQQHQGKIEVDSKEGGGTTFTIYLPISHEKKS